MLCDRIPEWLRNDPYFIGINDEIDSIEITKYIEALSKKVKQPIQVWVTPIPGTTLQYHYNVLVRATEKRPVRKVEFYNSNDELIGTFNYRKKDKVTLAFETLEGPFTSDTFYVKVYYFYYYKWEDTYLRHKTPAVKGFPQSATATDPKYLPNSALDDEAYKMGMFRRIYKESIDESELSETYPPYYPYDIEQDYWLEKRMLSQYTIRDEVNESEIINDLLEVRIKGLEVATITLSCYTTNDTKVIHVVCLYNNDVEIIEKFSSETIAGLVDSINADSKTITATFLKEGTLADGFYELKNQGVYTKYGLMKSEIHQYLGCIPNIVNITDYLLKWNVNKWNCGHLWGGDIYLPGTFYLNIPYYDIPKNFKLLTQDELQIIADQCKMFGTRVLPPQYEVESEVSCEADLEVDYPYYLVDTKVFIPQMQAITAGSFSFIPPFQMEVYAKTNIESTIDCLSSGGAIIFPSIIPSVPPEVMSEDGEMVWINEILDSKGRRIDVEGITEDGEEIIPSQL